jgi:hypothetical protein
MDDKRVGFGTKKKTFHAAANSSIWRAAQRDKEGKRREIESEREIEREKESERERERERETETERERERERERLKAHKGGEWR